MFKLTNLSPDQFGVMFHEVQLGNNGDPSHLPTIEMFMLKLVASLAPGYLLSFYLGTNVRHTWSDLSNRLCDVRSGQSLTYAMECLDNKHQTGVICPLCAKHGKYCPVSDIQRQTEAVPKTELEFAKEVAQEKATLSDNPRMNCKPEDGEAVIYFDGSSRAYSCHENVLNVSEVSAKWSENFHFKYPINVLNESDAI